MTDQATTEALSAIQLYAEKGLRFQVLRMLIDQFDCGFNDAFDLSEWLASHPDNFSAWIAINGHVPPSVSFDELRNGQMIVGDSLIVIVDRGTWGPAMALEWAFVRDIRNSSVQVEFPMGSTEAEARAFWEDNGYDLLYPVLNG